MTTDVDTNQALGDDAPTARFGETLADIVRLRANDDKTGLIFEGRSWTWAEVVREGVARSALLDSLVATPEERQVHVGVLLDNVPDFVFWLAGSALAGAVTVGINSARPAAELALDIKHADVDIIITEPSLRHLVEGSAHGVPDARILDIESDAYIDLIAAHRNHPEPAGSVDPGDMAFLMFSSGSTGRPKAVIVGQGRMARLAPVLSDRVEMTRDSVTYLCMPLFHGNAVMMNLIPAFATGATVGMVRKFSASRFADDIHAFGATFVNYVGRALSYVLSRPEDPRDRTSTLRLAFGTEASEADVARFSERFGCRVNEGYGLSEGVFRINRSADTPAGSLGRPAGDVDVRILDEATGLECPRASFDASGRLIDPSAVGQIVAVGLAHTFEGYYKNPEAMADRIHGDDFWSGDLGYRDQDGWFYFAGRSSDWLRVDSENFAAAQVERIILRFPGVASAPVYAVPDPVTGDRVMTALELEPGASFDAAAFGAFLSDQADLGPKWWPSYVRITERIPLTGSNKVDKAPLRHAAWATSEPVWMRVGRTDHYVEVTSTIRDQIDAEFAAHGRAALLPVRPAGV